MTPQAQRKIDTYATKQRDLERQVAELERDVISVQGKARALGLEYHKKQQELTEINTTLAALSAAEE